MQRLLLPPRRPLLPPPLWFLRADTGAMGASASATPSATASATGVAERPPCICPRAHSVFDLTAEHLYARFTFPLPLPLLPPWASSAPCRTVPHSAALCRTVPHRAALCRTVLRGAARRGAAHHMARSGIPTSHSGGSCLWKGTQCSMPICTLQETAHPARAGRRIHLPSWSTGGVELRGPWSHTSRCGIHPEVCRVCTADTPQGEVRTSR